MMVGIDMVEWVDDIINTQVYITTAIYSIM